MHIDIVYMYKVQLCIELHFINKATSYCARRCFSFLPPCKLAKIARDQRLERVLLAGQRVLIIDLRLFV